MSGKIDVKSIPADEQKKILNLLKEKYSNDGASNKLEFLYKEQKEDAEDYLLGKRVDDLSRFTLVDDVNKKTTSTDVEVSLLERRAQIDMEAKMREDPLYLIKQQEMDQKKKLVQNPVKLKRLQKLLSKQQAQISNKQKKKKHGHRHHKRDRFSDTDSDSDSDDELIQKYLSIIKAKDDKQYVESSSSQLDQSHRKEVTRSRGHFSRSSPLPRSSDAKNRSRSPPLSRSSAAKNLRQSPLTSRLPGTKNRSKSPLFSATKKRSKSPLPTRSSAAKNRSRSPPLSRSSAAKNRSRSPPLSRSSATKNRSRSPPLSRSSEAKHRSTFHQSSTAKNQSSGITTKRSAEDMERLRREMMLDAHDRDQERNTRVALHRAQVAKEELEVGAVATSHDGGSRERAFVRNMMLNHAGRSSVEEQVRRQAHRVQRSDICMNRNPFRK